MRLPRRAHAGIALATLLAIGGSTMSSGAQPAPFDPFAPVRLPVPTQDGATAAPAGSSPVESTDVPDVMDSPPRFAVAPFENRSNVKVFDWMVAAAPFEIAEKTEGVLGLEASGGALFVGAVPLLQEANAVAAFAHAHDATWVITGWVERPNWELRLAIDVWKVKGGLATRIVEVVKQGPVPTYHAVLGAAMRDAWTAAGVKIDGAQATQLARALAGDLYATNLMGRGLGHLAAAQSLPRSATDPVTVNARAKQLDLAQRDLERAVFIDPKCFEAQRLLGELYLAQRAASGDAKLESKAAGKFAYANDLAPEDLQALRAAAAAAARQGKAEVALPLFAKLVTKRPWDLDARYQYGAALWQTGDADRAERQLSQVTARRPDHLRARRVLVLIHAARNETEKLVGELESIALQAPDDLEIKADLASAYGVLGSWDRSVAQLEAIAAARPPDLALLVRIGDGYRRLGKLDAALAAYANAARQDPESSLPGFLAAQAQFDAGKLADAQRAYTLLLKYAGTKAVAEHALGVIAYAQKIPSQAAWNLRKATKDSPRELRTWRALIAAELLRKDAPTARADLDRAFAYWPDDTHLHYLSAIAAAYAGDRARARRDLQAAINATDLPSVRPALAALDANGAITLAYTPALIRPWGDAEALQGKIDQFMATLAAMAAVRLAYQTEILTVLGALGKGPYAKVKAGSVRVCPVAVVAPGWNNAQKQLQSFARLGVDLEATYDYLARHDAAGVGAALMPSSRTLLTNAKKTFRASLADVTELRSEWTRGLKPELRIVGCTDKLLAAVIANPDRYRVITTDKTPQPPETAPPRPKARATFFVDNSTCTDPVDVWIDGAQLGQVAPGRRSALVADAGEHTLCLLLPGSAQCGDRSTLRQIYLHDGWSVTLYCPRSQ